MPVRLAGSIRSRALEPQVLVSLYIGGTHFRIVRTAGVMSYFVAGRQVTVNDYLRAQAQAKAEAATPALVRSA